MAIDIENLSGQYEVRLIKDTDVPQVYECCRQNALFYKYCPPFVTEDSVREDMAALPPNKTADDKYYVGYFDKHRLGWVAGNPQAEHFWHKNGFAETGITYKTDDYTVIVAQRAV